MCVTISTESRNTFVNYFTYFSSAMEILYEPFIHSNSIANCLYPRLLTLIIRNNPTNFILIDFKKKKISVCASK